MSFACDAQAEATLSPLWGMTAKDRLTSAGRPLLVAQVGFRSLTRFLNKYARTTRAAASETIIAPSSVKTFEDVSLGFMSTLFESPRPEHWQRTRPSMAKVKPLSSRLSSRRSARNRNRGV